MFNFKLKLGKKLGLKSFLFLSISSSNFFWELAGLQLDWLSRLGHVGSIFTRFNFKTFIIFNFKLKLGKKLGRESLFLSISSSNFFYELAGLHLDWLSWLGHVRSIFTRFNFKFWQGKKLDKKVLKLNSWTGYNNKAK
jgi:hypothetical protein